MFTRKKRLALALAGLAVLSAALISAPAQADTVATGTLRIVGSSHCLDNATEDIGKLQMWSCTGGPEQEWQEETWGYNGIYQQIAFQNVRTQWCITVQPGYPVAFMAPCTPGPSTGQLFTVAWDSLEGDSFGKGRYEVWYNAATQLCLTTPSVGNGTLPQPEPCNRYDQYDAWHFG